MCSKWWPGKSREKYAFSALGCHATYSRAVVTPRAIEEFALQHDHKACVYVYETHADGTPHTHAVFYAKGRVRWGIAALDEVHFGGHITQLRARRDVYRCFAYLCKEATPNIWVNPNGGNPIKIREKILDAIWVRNHNPRYPGAASLVFEEAYRRCKEAWFPQEAEEVVP